MFVFKPNFIVSVFCLSVCASAAFANHSSDYNSTGEYKPMSMASVADPREHYELSFIPIALKAGASNLNYVIYNKALPLQSPSWTEQELRPSYAFAFELAGRYRFDGGNDVSLDWTHMNSSVSSNVAAPNSQYFLGPDYDIGPDASVIRNASGKARFKYDVVNINAGQTVNFGMHTRLHVFGGLSNALLREEVLTTYSGINGAPFAGAFSMQQDVKANFTGMGPRLGVDATFDTRCGLSFYGQGAGTALIGSAYAKTGYSGNSPQVLALFGTTINSQFIGDQNVTQVLPAFDMKAGLDYTHDIYRGVKMTLGAGYQAAVYINAINQYLPQTLVAGTSVSTGGIFVATMNHTQSNYSVHGPFLKVAVNF